MLRVTSFVCDQILSRNELAEPNVNWVGLQGTVLEDARKPNRNHRFSRCLKDVPDEEVDSEVCKLRQGLEQRRVAVVFCGQKVAADPDREPAMLL